MHRPLLPQEPHRNEATVVTVVSDFKPPPHLPKAPTAQAVVGASGP